MRKKIFLILALISTLFLISCNGKELPENYDKKEMENISMEVIEDINSKRYNGAYEKYCSENLKSKITKDKIKAIVEKTQNKKGLFQKFKRAKFVGAKHPEDKTKRIGVSIINCRHDKKDVIYTISFNEDMKITEINLN